MAVFAPKNSIFDRPPCTVHILDFGNDFSTANAIINEQNGIITVISEGQLQGQLQETNGGTTYEYIPLQTVNAGENGPQTRDPIQVLKISKI